MRTSGIPWTRFTPQRCSDVQFSSAQFTGFGLYDKSFVNTLRELKDPTPFIRGIVAELGPERKEIEYEQPQHWAGKTHNNWYTLYDAAMLSFASYTKAGLRLATFFGFIVAGISFLIGLFYLVAKLLFWDKFSAGYAPTMIAVFMTAPTCTAYHCPSCRKVILDYGV